VLTDWKNAIGDRQMIHSIPGSKRAFEVIDRSVLLKKLQRYGLRAAVLEWFKCYLENRSHTVKFNGVLSEPIDVNFGVSQDSVLGPLLFLLYINDITEVMTADCSIRLFADDALIYATGSSRQEINERLNEQMIRVDNWLSRNRLYPNVSKTKAMLIRGIRRKVTEQDFKVMFRGRGELEVVNKIRYLRVIIDKNLNFVEHVDYIGRKKGAKLGVLRRVGNYMTPYMRCIVYKSVIAPLFDCASVLIGLNKTGLQYLQKLQNKAMRVVLRCNRGVRTDMLQALNFMSIKERIEFNVCLLIFKMINGRCSSYLHDRVNLVRYEGALAIRRGDKVCIER